MPKIVIKGKGLAKAQYAGSLTTSTTTLINPNINTNPFFQSYLQTTPGQPSFSQTELANQSAQAQGIVKGKDFLQRKDKQGNLVSKDPSQSFLNKTINKAGAWGNRTQQKLGKFYGALDDINSVLGQIDANKKYKQGQQFTRQNQLPDNIYNVKQQSDADVTGRYNINTGMLGRQGLYTVNEGQTTNNTNFLPERVWYNQARDGGESTGMKIRITRTPDQDIMAYGGQARHSLDLRRDALATPNIKYEDDYEVNDTLKPVPRDEANIEAEKDETAFGDFDGDGNFEHMKIGGKRHHEGGTPLNLPEGTFIFSDTAKMRIKDEDVLSYFSLKPKKGGYTPAEIAKRYDVNKYKGMIDDPEADSISKTTAEQMIKNYNKKLAYLALIQESMKGFPQGIPEVCKKILGIEDNTEGQEMQASPEDEEAMSAEMMQQPQQGGMEEEMPQEEMPEQGMARYGTSIKQLRKYQGATGGSTVTDNPLDQSQYDELVSMYDIANRTRNPNDILNFQKKYHQYMPNKATDIILSNPNVTQHGLRKYRGYGVRNISDLRNLNPDLIRQSNEDKLWGPRTEQYRASIQPPPPPPPPASTTTKTTLQPDTPLVPPGKIGETTPPKAVNKGPLRPDVRAMFAATAYSPRNYQIGLKSPPPTQEQVFLNEPRQALAENQSLFNAAAANLNAMGDVRTTGALMSNLQGEALKGATGIVGDVQDKNVERMTQWAARNRAYQDQYNKEAADLSNQRGFVGRDTDVFNRNQGRAFERGRAAVEANMYNNMIKMNLLNSVNKNFAIDPWTTELTFKPGYGVNDLRARGSQYNYPSKEHYSQLKQSFPTLTEAEYLKMGSTFKQDQQDADPYAAYYNFYNPMTGGQ